MNITDFEQEYVHTISILKQTGILTLLPKSESSGVIGIDGKEYPAPTQNQLQELFSRNKELVERKIQQGFTQLQLTPIAMPSSQLMDHANANILKHARAGKIFQAKQNSIDADIAVRVNTGAPLWIWERVRQALDTPQVVYFPQTYIEPGHQGFTKEEVIPNPRFCAVPGWSVGLIEPITIMPQEGQGNVMAGRKQLEGYSTPREYLQTLNSPPFQGETGWTLEDFLTYFITRLETTNQISHDRTDGNALWLLGSYLPKLMPTPHLVLVGYWSRDVGRKMYLSAHRTGNRLKMCVARSMVRLGT